MAFCHVSPALGAEDATKHAIAVQYQTFDDDTVISQSFAATGLTYRYQPSQYIGIDVEYFRITGDRSGNFYRLGVSGAVSYGPVDLNYGIHHYQQDLSDLPVDSGDTGYKLMLGLGYEIRQFSIDLNYYSEDVEGSHPDDPGDYVELDRLELDVRYRLAGSPWSFEYKYTDSVSDYNASALAVRFSF